MKTNRNADLSNANTIRPLALYVTDAGNGDVAYRCGACILNYYALIMSDARHTRNVAMRADEIIDALSIIDDDRAATRRAYRPNVCHVCNVRVATVD